MTRVESKTSPPRKTVPDLSSRSYAFWRTLQTAVWLIGLAIFGALLFFPSVGIHAFWNVLIPVAPALVMIAPGLWRNICPMGSTALLARHMNWTTQRRVPPRWQSRLQFLGVILLLVIVPLRHVVLDLNGLATAMTIAILALIAVAMSAAFQWKSAWCSGMCPVHPVERLYGSAPIATFTNAHCHQCVHCVVPCPDSVTGTEPLIPQSSGLRRITGALMVGGFAGFIWGWFHVPDYAGAEGLRHLGQAYGLPLGAMMVTLVAFLGLELIIPREHHLRLRRVFAAAAIACYYWYRLPALFGFGPFPGDGMLIDAREILPLWCAGASRVVTTVFCVWWLAGRTSINRSWLTPHRIAADTAEPGLPLTIGVAK